MAKVRHHDPSNLMRVTFAALTLLCASALARADSDPRLDEAGQAIEAALASSARPGLVIGVTDRRQLRKVIVHGYADLKTKAPLTAGSRFAIGSISKAFTAISLMQLADEGRFDPSDPITKYLPALKIPSHYAAIRGKDLLSHTSGLPGYLADAASSRFSEIELSGFEPRYAPGRHWVYSNTGYQLLGYALEQIDHASYAQIIQRRILDPLGMTSTSAIIDDAQRTSMVVSYRRWPYDGRYVEAPWFEYTAGDGSIVSTASDMASYLRLILNRGVRGSTRVLSERAFAELTRPVSANYGYGLWIRERNGHTIISHSGSIAGFDSYIEIHMDEGFGVVFLANGGMDPGFEEWVMEAVAAAFAHLPLPPAPKAAADPLEAAYAGYAGHYTAAGSNTGNESVDIAVIDGGLALTDARGIVTPLQRMGVDSFRANGPSGDTLAYIFARPPHEGTGKVMGLSHGARWYAAAKPTGAATEPTADYSAFAGHYSYNGPEGPDVRIFVRDGQLTAALGWDEELYTEPLVPLAPGVFRMGQEDYSPERATFDAMSDGHPQRLILSGVSLYRRDTP